MQIFLSEVRLYLQTVKQYITFEAMIFSLIYKIKRILKVGLRNTLATRIYPKYTE